MRLIEKVCLVDFKETLISFLNTLSLGISYFFLFFEIMKLAKRKSSKFIEGKELAINLCSDVKSHVL